MGRTEILPAVFVGNDSPAEWTFYYAGAGCCLLPLTGTLAWLLSRNARTKRVGQGAAVGLLAATALAVLALFTGYSPPALAADPRLDPLRMPHVAVSGLPDTPIWRKWSGSGGGRGGQSDSSW
ncbi:hypothetical protein [Micromonospora sp. KC721]|uniref:hypothetical protein n=1 Tax=Micromonospora sp. KC721 TaxID=2530380 RepID=UPI0010491BC9|nr:hypothetical protein [Micromonospora sp. KC721]TDB69906.1 hypothetical protein E1182_28620 [Micromonospora sp. KC721]